MKPQISVIICTHNPWLAYLNQVLSALQGQTLPVQQWELIVVDNASAQSLASRIDLSWHPAARLVREERLGLTAARLSGFQAARGDLLVYVDDDNVLDANYLTQVLQIFTEFEGLGAIGGKSLPEFEVAPKPWVSEFYKVLALRDFGDEPLVHMGSFGTLSQNTYPDFAPAGIGLAVRRQAFLSYTQWVTADCRRLALGRTGNQLTSGEDNDIILTLLNAGWGVGYFPQLQLKHLIPARRLQRDYLGQLNRAACRSWVRVMDIHGIRVWQKIPSSTLVLRKAKAFFAYRAWQDAAAYVHWQGACGTFEGLASLSN
ncbi:family 2 glycosyl transferase [Leptolyngbya sp. 'hensonii']|uniref:glycosyltransferase n=1 Tax=Leptolyngbya sp. 'hensonii' TaxID=1922337 RepID=UPI00094FBF8B|nr:glycosyltransferase [Leptolyngbya sp. 'hensonii']OLP17815.1 family 2 glycosyl transferase [Leptolyngbya sp. 'hensonii']